ncbi:MAG: hypothetical protein MHMPM18_003023 [Marteilia pararefringens]
MTSNPPRRDLMRSKRILDRNIDDFQCRTLRDLDENFGFVKFLKSHCKSKDLEILQSLLRKSAIVVDRQKCEVKRIREEMRGEKESFDTKLLQFSTSEINEDRNSNIEDLDFRRSEMEKKKVEYSENLETLASIENKFEFIKQKLKQLLLEIHQDFKKFLRNEIEEKNEELDEDEEKCKDCNEIPTTGDREIDEDICEFIRMRQNFLKISQGII